MTIFNDDAIAMDNVNNIDDLKEYKEINKKTIFSQKQNGVSADRNKIMTNRNKIIDYLKNKKYALFVSSARIYDEYKGESISDYIKVWYADNYYKWTSLDIYYFENYDFPLSREFVNHIMKNS